MSETENLPEPYDHRGFRGLNERVIVAYEEMSPSAFIDETMNEDATYLGTDRDVSTRAYARPVRRHTAQNHDGLTIIPEDSPMYCEAFESLAMGEEIPL